MTALPALGALLGAVVGSFATMASHRLPLGLPLGGRSRCGRCGGALGARDLVPVLSWALARGRCRHCGAGVSPRYPSIELATAALFAATLALFGATPVAAALCGLALGLVVLAVVDLEHGLLPDVVLLPLALLGLAVRALLVPGLGDAALGAALGGGIGLLLHHGYRRLRGREGLGMGDVKFLAMAGVWLGPIPMGWFLALGGAFGVGYALATGKRGTAAFPLGPALCAALYLTLLLRLRGIL